MTSYLSNILTHTTSKYTSLRRALLSDEHDGDTEDDTHISRVLRAYYTEKQLPFPAWLPADPNKPAAPTGQFAAQYASGPARSQQASLVSARRGGAGLSDLWDSPGGVAAPAQPQSLRGAMRSAGREGSYSSQTSTSSSSSGRLGGPRPMAQEAGSFSSQGGISPGQGSSGQRTHSPRPGLGAPTSSSSSAQDRLKAKLWAGSGSGQGSFGR